VKKGQATCGWNPCRVVCSKN